MTLLIQEFIREIASKIPSYQIMYSFRKTTYCFTENCLVKISEDQSEKEDECYWFGRYPQECLPR